jgi:hypothetical protein
MSRSERIAPIAGKPEPGLLRIAETIAAGCALGLLLTRPRWGLRVLSLISARHRLLNEPSRDDRRGNAGPAR